MSAMAGKLASLASRPSPLRCLICGNSAHTTVLRELEIDILRCRQCGHIFSSFRADPHYKGFWGNEVADTGHVYWSHARNPMYEDFLKRFVIGRSGRLLDVGCGLGFFLQRVAEVGGWETYGSEISPAAARYAREKLGLSRILCGPPEKIDLPEKSFDIVTLWDVLDHVAHPDPVLGRCRALLKSGGMCFIRTPNVRLQLPRARINRMLKGARAGVSYLQVRDHLHHYSSTTVQKLLERNGFSAVEFLHLRPVQHPDEGRVRSMAKTAWFAAVELLAAISRGRLNYDNLFVIARKG
jgi:2-polyprenyl-3-methyl-5-hydroxy-6-metoxy-1,4-benzoquinol methylase